MNISVINNFSSKRRLQEALLFVQRCSLYRMFPVNKFLRIFPPIKHFCLLISPLAVRRNTATSCHYKPRTGRNGQLISMPLQQHGQQIKSMLLQKWSNLGYYAATSRSRCIDICRVYRHFGPRTLRTQDTSDLPKFGPRTLRHDRSVRTLQHWCRSVLRTLRHWCRSVLTEFQH